MRLVIVIDATAATLQILEEIDQKMPTGRYVSQREFDQLCELFERLEGQFVAGSGFSQIISLESDLGRPMFEKYQRLKQHYDTLQPVP